MKKQLFLGFGIIFSFLFLFFFFVSTKEFRERNRVNVSAGSPTSGGYGMFLPNQQSQIPQQNQPYFAQEQQVPYTAPTPTIRGRSQYLGTQIPSGIVYFAFDSNTPPSSSRNSEIQKISTQADYLLIQAPNVNIIIEGHTDARGTQEYNLALGQRRAEWTAQKLLEAGVSPSRIRTISYGKEVPAVSGNTESAFSRNRRTNTVLE